MSGLQLVMAAQGIVLLALSLAMLIPAAVDFLASDDSFRAFLLASSIACVLGGTVLLASMRSLTGTRARVSYRDSFLIMIGAWVVAGSFGGLPFVFAIKDFSYVNALFESMSGLTTTGSTVLTGLDTLPSGLLLWRSLLQWVGGIGIILTTVLLFPLLRVGGMQLFRVELAGQGEKAVARLGQLVAWIVVIYAGLTFCCGFLYWLFDMSLFDAVNHAMTTVATGGFSTHDESFGFFDNARIETVAVVFMILGSLPLVLYLQILLGRGKRFLLDEQVRWFLPILLFIVAVAFFPLAAEPHLGIAAALRASLFNMTSLMTGTGYVSEDYSSWGAWAVSFCLFVMFIGGCAGSTSCGIKIFRIIVLFKTALLQMRQMLQPRRVFTMMYNGRAVPPTIGHAVMGYFFILFLFFGFLSVCLGFTGLDFLTAISGSATALANVGPGLGGVIGPSGNFSVLPDSAKLMMVAGMLLGRLEFFAILMIFAPTFWRG